MTFYIMSERDSQIVEIWERRPTQAELDDMAQEFDCDLWVIDGEHAGLTGAKDHPKTKSAFDAYPGCKFCGGKGCLACTGERLRDKNYWERRP